MDYEKKFILGDLVKGLRTFNGEIIEGEFNGFHLHNKLDPTSVIGVICVENDRCYDVVVGSIELLESEDEKIRNALLEMIHDTTGDSLWVDYNVHKEDALAWLEKQGEQKPIISNNALREGIAHFGITQYQIDNWLKKYVDIEKQSEQKPVNKAEPKFRVGDWIIKNDDSSINIDYSCCEITKVENGNYTIESIYGYKGYNTFETFEKDYHLWTIQDAKDGDILVFDDIIMIFKNIKKDCTANTYILYCDKIVAVGEWCDFGYNALPATKEQRDFLFQKMKEAGYEWDANKKVLKKIK